MPLITPKTDWIAGDSVGFSDMNRIEGNTLYLQSEDKIISGTTTFEDQVVIEAGAVGVGKDLLSLKDSTGTDRGGATILDIYDDNASTAGEATISFRNFSTTSANRVYMGLNQDADFGIAYGTVFDGASTRFKFFTATGNFGFGVNPVDNGTDRIQASEDEDESFSFGKCKFGFPSGGTLGRLYLSHRDHFSATDFALRQDPDGSVRLNSPISQGVTISSGGNLLATFSNAQIFFDTPTVLDMTVGAGNNSLKIIDSTAGDRALGTMLLLDADSATTGEASIGFKNAGASGTGSDQWYLGLNQDSDFSLAYGQQFSGGNTLAKVSSDTGYLLLNTSDSELWEGVNAETNGNLSIKYSNVATTTSGPSLTFINDAGQFSTRDPYTSSVIKSKHYSSANNERQSSLEFYTHSGGAAGSGSLTKVVEVFHDKVVFEKNIETLSGIKTDNVTLKTKVVEIGAWNMSSGGGGSLTKSVVHGLTRAKIRRVKVVIVNDSATITYPLEYVPFNELSSTTAIPEGSLNATATNIVMRIRSGGWWNAGTNTEFDGTQNRGYIEIEYEA